MSTLLFYTEIEHMFARAGCIDRSFVKKITFKKGIDKVDFIVYNIDRKKGRDKTEREDRTMKTNELRERLERLENNLFMIYMVDRWTSEDERRVNLIEREIEDIKRELNV